MPGGGATNVGPVKTRVIFPLVALLLGALTARAGWIEDRPDGTTVIHVTLWWMPDPTRTDQTAQSEVAAIREFVRQFPETFARKYRDRYRTDTRHRWDHVEIQLHQFSGITVEGVENDLLAIAGGTAPDVLYVNFRKSDTYIQQGFLQPLDSYMSELSPSEVDLRIHPKIWPVIKRPGPGGATHVWALPWGGPFAMVVLYRKDLFDAAGIPYPGPDWTWEDMYQACRKIADPQRGIYGLRLAPGTQEAWLWQNFLWSAGGESLIQDKATGAWHATFDSREAATALDFYTRLCNEPWTDRQGRTQRGYVFKSDDFIKWDRGEIGMAFSYMQERVFATINPALTGVAPVPLGPGGRRGCELNNRMMGLFAGIKEPAVRDAAWEYLRFYDSPEAVAIKLRVLVQGGLGAAINPKFLKMFGYDDLVRLTPQEWPEVFNIAMDAGRPEPYGPNCALAYNIMTEPIQAADQLAYAGKLPQDEQARLTLLQGLLKQATDKANREMLGLISPRERVLRRLSAGVMLAFVAIGIVTAIAKLIGTLPRNIGSHRRRYVWAVGLLAPALLTILVWQYVPLGWSAVMAFQNHQIFGASKWVWLDNFGDVLWSGDWWRAVWTNLRYTLWVVALTVLPPLVLAIGLQEIPRGKVLFRMIYYLPVALTGLVAVLLWKQFCDPSPTGLFNAVVLHVPRFVFALAGLVLLGLAAMLARRLFFHGHRWQGALCVLAGAILAYTCVSLTWAGEPRRWLADPDTALFCCVLPMLWVSIGPGALIYLAALKGVSNEVCEASELDGATFLDKLLFIVVPALRPLLIINLVGAVIASWQSEANILAMTGGAANTEIAGLHIFYQALTFLKFGPAITMAWMVAVLLIGFTVYQLRVLLRAEFRTPGEVK